MVNDNRQYNTADTVEQDRSRWLQRRKRLIGASDVGTILGLNPHESPMSLYLRKRGEIEDKEMTLAMWLGHEMEPIIAKRYTMETGRHLHDPGDFKILYHTKYQWLAATPDRTAVLDGERGPVELKAPGERMAKQWSDTDAPLCYQVQLQIQMACMDAKVGEIAAIVGNDRFYCVRYERDDDFLEAVIPVLHDFWIGIIDGIPPEIDGSEATRKAIRALHPDDSGESIVLNPSFEAELERLTELERDLDACTLEIQQIKNRIMYEIGANTYAFLNGDCVFSYKTQRTAGGKNARILRRIK